MAGYFIGTSGWVYPHWKGLFYPGGVPQARWLEFYSRHSQTVYIYFNNDAEAHAGQRPRPGPTAGLVT